MVTDNELRIVAVKKGLAKRMLCPHCDQLLPLSTTTECDECGAWLELSLETTAPPQSSKT